MRIPLLIFVALTTLGLGAKPAGADAYGCDDWDYATVTLVDAYYIDVRFIATMPEPSGKYVVSVYVYEETNGQSGLQRGDIGDPCWETETPDTMLF